MRSNKPDAAPRKFRLSLGIQDSVDLKELATKLGISESEVMRKGLQLMALYMETRESKDAQLVIRKGDTEQETRIVI